MKSRRNFERCSPKWTYAESWADAWGRHGGKTDPRWCPPGQYNYWRLLGDLNWGVSFIAIYGADLKRWQEPEFRAAFDFTARYVGYHASPKESPGAWVALREGNQLKGDYSFLMTRRAREMPPVEKAGPDDQRFGAWARTLKKGTTARFALNADFARSLAGRPATLNVVYLDRGTGSMELSYSGKRSSCTLKNTGRWVTATFPLDRASFGEDIVVSANTDLVLHMVEIRR